MPWLRSASSRPPPDEGGDGLLLEELRRVGDDHHLRLRVEGVEPRLPPEVRSALLSAAGEAFSNIARHSGTDVAHVTVTARTTPAGDGVTVSIADAGRGFAPSTIPSRRFGLRASLPGHMAQVGGDVVVASAPGRGTSVHLSWEPVESPRVTTHTMWDPQRLPPHRIFIGCWLLIHGLGAWRFHEAINLPGLWSLGAVVFLTFVALLLHRGTRRRATAVAVALPLSFGTMTAALEIVPGADPRWWFTGAVVPVIITLAALGHLRQAWHTSLWCASSVVAIAFWHGGTAGALAAIEASAQLPLYAVIATIMNHSLNVLAEQRRRSLADALHSRAEAEVARQRVRESDARRAVLTLTAVPLLHTLVWADVVTASHRSAMAAAECALRDHLVGGSLLDDQVEAAAAAARGRGASVTLLSDEGRPDVNAPAAVFAHDSTPAPSVAVELLVLRRLTCSVLECVSSKSVVIVRWDLTGDGPRATLTATELTTHPETLDVDVIRGATRLDEVVVEVDHELTWVEWPRQGPVEGLADSTDGSQSNPERSALVW